MSAYYQSQENFLEDSQQLQQPSFMMKNCPPIIAFGTGMSDPHENTSAEMMKQREVSSQLIS